MKKILTILVALITLPAYGRDVKLTWDPNPEDNILGYRVHFSKNPDMTWGATIDVGNVTEYIVTHMPDDEVMYFTVTVYNTNYLESDPSNIVMSIPGVPGVFLMQPKQLTIIQE